MKSKACAQNQSGRTGMVRSQHRRKIIGQAGPDASPKGPAPSSLPEWPAPGEWTRGSHHIFHPGITQLWPCCHRGASYPLLGETSSLGSHYQVKEEGAESPAVALPGAQRRRWGRRQALPSAPGRAGDRYSRVLSPGGPAAVDFAGNPGSGPQRRGRGARLGVGPWHSGWGGMVSCLCGRDPARSPRS